MAKSSLSSSSKHKLTKCKTAGQQSTEQQPTSDNIRIRGARQHNLKNISLEIQRDAITVVTGLSGSGKSALVFDTLYAQGQRRYVETFSPYARQFLDRMDKPEVDAIENLPPAIAINQNNSIRTSRSTVGTMTEINDYLKLLFARAAQLYCWQCAQEVKVDTPVTIAQNLCDKAQQAGNPRLVVTFPLAVPKAFTAEEVLAYLNAQGYTRVHSQQLQDAPLPESEDNISGGNNSGALKRRKKASTQVDQVLVLNVVQDRFRAGAVEQTRLIQALEAALMRGQNRLDIQVLDEQGETQAVWRYSAGLHCAPCNLAYSAASPAHFSFNSAIGACGVCRGFGRIIGIDYGLVVPDEHKTLAQGAIKPWQTPSFQSCQDQLLAFAKKRGVPIDVPWRSLSVDHRNWVIAGDEQFDGHWEGQYFYGLARFFQWLESRTYKMHVRVLLSKYRAYTACETCLGARLKTEGLLWRLGGGQVGVAAGSSAVGLGRYQRFRPNGVAWSHMQVQSLPGVSIHDLMLAPIAQVAHFFDNFHLSGALGRVTEHILIQLRSRLSYLTRVGLGYLNLDRQSRTLSGGELQRIQLTTALGSALVNTLFVLDEPSVGLHPRDVDYVVQAMHALKAVGNTLVVVEHDPQIMLTADRLIDMGPGPGQTGGQIVFDGTAQAARFSAGLTGQYLSGRKRIAMQRPMLGVDDTTAFIELKGITANNLKNIDVRFPLQRLVLVTGVSGSGKSTLIQDVLVPAIGKAKGEPSQTPGAFSGLFGDELIEAVVFVDQSTIGKTTRSNPASYVGAFDALRKLFSKTDLAKELEYSAGFFSFNSGDGRCPGCGGNGYEHVEMQFLADVYLRCGQCNGSRYRADVLEVTLQRQDRLLNIADVLELSITEALELFAQDTEVLSGLQALQTVGLGYIKLGQPVPTLSGGEAQRLKLAGFLAQAATAAKAAKRQKKAQLGILFVFDEPSTGLHFDDIAKLMGAFDALLAAGHSIIIVEHQLDIIRCADWVIDLGPEAGEAGGQLVCAGTPKALMANQASHTGRALARYINTIETPDVTFGVALDTPSEGIPLQTAVRQKRGFISVLNARENNLRDVSLDIPHQKMTVITGPSGSGKSTLAFDIIFAQGQQRYLDSLNAYCRQFVQPAAKPDVDAIYGLAPTVAIAQRTSRGGLKSTVATVTEIYHFLRLLFIKLGVQHCPDCQVPIAPQTFDAIVAQCLNDYKGKAITVLAPLVIGRKGVYNEIVQKAKNGGVDRLRVDGEYREINNWVKLDRYKEHHIEMPVDYFNALHARDEIRLRQTLLSALSFAKGFVMIDCAGTTQFFSTQCACPKCARSFPPLDPRLLSYNSKYGWCSKCMGTGTAHFASADANNSSEEFAYLDMSVGVEADHQLIDAIVCGLCDGQRLNETALSVLFQSQSIAQVAAQTVEQALFWLAGLKLEGREQDIAQDIVQEMAHRLSFLQRVGLSYLKLDRSVPTLSGGEAQRIRLAAQLGSHLTGVCYVLDEPTIGLHTRDNQRLLLALKELQAKGNTLLVVEHDEDTICSADVLVDMGPGAGVRGGLVTAQGSVAEVTANTNSLTGRYLSRPISVLAQPRRPVLADTSALWVRKANLHNLQGVDVRIPLGRWVAITGVSGSGKSTLAREVLLKNLQLVFSGQLKPTSWHGCAGIEGFQAIGRVLEVDQTPIGRTPRSCLATYIGFWDTIRQLMADTLEAGMRGYAASRFSFNTGAGRCSVCEGQGLQTVEMNFLPDVKVVCEACNGQRFNLETLQVRWRGKNVAEILAMSVDEAVVFFQAHPSIAAPLQLLQDVGLGYITLGQPSPTLSGGEAQRIKLVAELSKVRIFTEVIQNSQAQLAPLPRLRQRHTQALPTLYVLDEPTVGLHMSDVEKLIAVLHRLVDAGHTVLTIEHDLDLIAQVDWVIDLGPDGGIDGGRLVAQAAPAVLAKKPEQSHTAKALADLYQRRLSV